MAPRPQPALLPRHARPARRSHRQPRRRHRHGNRRAGDAGVDPTPVARRGIVSAPGLRHPLPATRPCTSSRSSPSRPCRGSATPGPDWRYCPPSAPCGMRARLHRCAARPVVLERGAVDRTGGRLDSPPPGGEAGRKDRSHPAGPSARCLPSSASRRCCLLRHVSSGILSDRAAAAGAQGRVPHAAAKSHGLSDSRLGAGRVPVARARACAKVARGSPPARRPAPSP